MEKRQFNRKEVILSTAKKLFAQKGFDGSSMDELAKQAGVPKSLIYYHFKNKEELLSAIMERFFSQYEDLLKTNYIKSEKERIKVYLDFLYENNDFLRILVVESLKNNGNTTNSFQVISKLLQYESEITGNDDLLSYEKSHCRWVAEFFTNMIPCVLFACLVDDWSEHFKSNTDSVKEDFLAIYQKSHGGLHVYMEEDM